jgi:hypothetical protein
VRKVPSAGAYQRLTTQDRWVASSAQEPWKRKSRGDVPEVQPVGTVPSVRRVVDRQHGYRLPMAFRDAHESTLSRSFWRVPFDDGLTAESRCRARRDPDTVEETPPAHPAKPPGGHRQ